MKKTIALMTAVTLCLLLAACGSGGQPAGTPEPTVSAPASAAPEIETLEITLAVSEDLTAAEYDSLDAWAARVSERSGESVVIQCTRDGGKDTSALLEETGAGTANITVASTDALRTYLPEAVLLRLPFMLDSYDHAAAVFGGEIGDRLSEELVSENGVRVLNTFFGGFRYVLSEMQLSTPEDCFGILIRAPRKDVFTDMMGIMGFSYITIDESDAYTAMNDGVISAVEGTLSDLYGQKFYEQGKYILCTRHMLEMRHVVVNDAWWSGLTEQQRTILTETLAEVAAEQWAACQTEEELARSALEAEGVTFTKLEKSAKNEFVELFAEYWQAELGGFGEEISGMPEEIRDLA